MEAYASVPLGAVGPGGPGGLNFAMNKYWNWFLLVSLLGFAVGFAGLGGSMVAGYGRAIGAVFFLLFGVSRLLSAAEAEQ